MTDRKLTPADARVVEAIDRALQDLHAARDLFPLVRNHASRRPSDRPTNVEAADKTALLSFLRALQGVQGATAGLRRRLPVLAGVSDLPSRHAAVEAQPDPPSPGGSGPACAACGTARGPFRRGLCDRDRKRWERAGRPDLAQFVETIHDQPTKEKTHAA